MQISTSGINHIKQFEALRLNAYRDSVGIWTIGYGHTGNVAGGDIISAAQAEAFLRADVHRFEVAVSSAVKVPLNQNQFDALVSFAFNIGVAAFTGSSLVRKLNAGNYDVVPTELMKWTHAGHRELPGLVARRRAEAGIWRGPTVEHAQPVSRVVGPVRQAPAPVGATAPTATAVAGGGIAAAELLKTLTDTATQAQPFLSLGHIGALIGVALMLGAGYVLWAKWREQGFPNPFRKA